MSVRIYDDRIHVYENWELEYRIQHTEDVEVIIMDEDIVLEIRELDEMLNEIDRDDWETYVYIADQICNMERTVLNRRAARRAAMHRDE